MAEKGLSYVSDPSDNDGITKKAMFGDFGGDKADYTLGNTNIYYTLLYSDLLY